jgi:hypothetical protein
MLEMNPEHPTTKGVHDHWYKVCALLMLKMGVKDITISPQEIERIEGNNIAIKFDDKLGIILKLLSDEEIMSVGIENGAVPEGQYRRDSITRGRR